MVKSIIRSSIRVMEQALKQQIGVAVRQARKRAEMTQERLAELISKSAEAVSNIERGLALPTLATLLDITQALDVPLSSLVSGISAKKPKPPKRLALELQLQAAMDQLDDRLLETAIKQISILIDLRR
jgi:transcriptional regulator with XRE-family HTH domain